MHTTVINIYHKVPYDEYIGRPGKGQEGYFGNPFHGPSREDNIKMFREYFYNRLKNDKVFAKKVINLKGKTLGCFCKPKACHGDIIAEYLNNLPDEKPLRLAVVGSREFDNYAQLCEVLEWFNIKKIISGGARGADTLAKQYAIKHGIDYQEFPADWEKHGKSAGFKRNVQIVDACDEVVAFWDGSSKGTKHTIDIAEERGKPVHVYKPAYIDEIAQLG